MKILHSFWSKPAMAVQKTDGGRKDGGWLRARYQYYSCALSCLKARDAFGAIDLVTDRLGKEILVDAMNLPYRKVEVLLDELNGFPTELWAVGKLFAYQVQREPFFHIDNDIFLWAPFSPQLLAAPLVAQNPELNLDYYKQVLETCDALEIQLPEFIRDVDRKSIFSSNAGVIGGNDFGFFARLSKDAFDFIHVNRNKIETATNASLFNVLFEQLFYHHLARIDEIEIQYVVNKINPNKKELVNFHITPSRNGYIHVFGNSLKRDQQVIDNVELAFKLEFPDYYYKVNSLLKEFQI